MLQISTCDFRPIALVYCLTFAVAARAQPDAWLLTTPDFRTDRVVLRGIDDRGLTVSTLGANAAPRSISFDRFLQIDRISTPRVAAPRFILELVSGDRLAGEPRGIEGQTLTWAGASVGDVKLPVGSVVSITRAKTVRGAGEERTPGTEDVVTLANGDIVRGILNALASNSIAVQRTDGEVVEVPLESIDSIDFAAAPGKEPPPRAGRAFRAMLADGSIITASSIVKADGTLLLRLDDNPSAVTSRSVRFADVISIEQLNGPVIWLSSLTPSENIQIPFLDYSAPARMNLTVAGRPIRFADREFSRGIGVHSYSRITWPIDPAVRAFRTQYAIDGDLPYANVTVRIRLGDRLVHEKSNVRAGVLWPVVVLDVNGEPTITLEVDYGETYDVQDRFNWIEPALLKSKPDLPSPPATAPTSQTAR